MGIPTAIAPSVNKVTGCWNYRPDKLRLRLQWSLRRGLHRLPHSHRRCRPPPHPPRLAPHRKLYHRQCLPHRITSVFESTHCTVGRLVWNAKCQTLVTSKEKKNDICVRVAKPHTSGMRGDQVATAAAAATLVAVGHVGKPIQRR